MHTWYRTALLTYDKTTGLGGLDDELGEAG